MNFTVFLLGVMIFIIAELVIFVLVPWSRARAFEKQTIQFFMDNVSPTEPETYLCSVYPVNQNETKFVVGFEPKASMKDVHHMLLYGCSEPGKPEGVWNCGGMSHGHGHHHHKQNVPVGGPVCQGEQQIIYAWARNAPTLELPDNVAFEIGKDTDISYLVLQIHYADVSSFQDGKTDASGVILHYTTIPQPRTAGILILSSGGEIAPHSTEHLEVACGDLVDENVEIHPFRFRTHTHNLGKFVSGYHVRRDSNGVDQWTLIGKRDPMDPQMFYPVENEITVRKGDILAARCTMVSDRERFTEIGPTNSHEMCNFYIMYWTEKGYPNRMGCGSPGPPTFYWNKGSIPGSSDQLNNLPPYSATDE